MRQTFFQDQMQGRGKRERTRSALLDGALAVVAEKGVEGARIADIAAVAGLANGTFYNHFADKDEILLTAALGIVEEIGRRLDEEMQGVDNAIARVITATNRSIDIILQEPDWAHWLLDSARQLAPARRDTLQYLRADLERGVAQGKFDVTVDDFLVTQIAALISAAMARQLDRGASRRETQQLCENIMRLLGLTPVQATREVAKHLPD